LPDFVGVLPYFVSSQEEKNIYALRWPTSPAFCATPEVWQSYGRKLIH